MSGWQTKRLGDVLQLNYGKSLPVKSRVEDRFLFMARMESWGVIRRQLLMRRAL